MLAVVYPEPSRYELKDVPIPERAVVKFKPGKEMRAEVIKLTPKAGASASAPA